MANHADRFGHLSTERHRVWVRTRKCPIGDEPVIQRTVRRGWMEAPVHPDSP